MGIHFTTVFYSRNMANTVFFICLAMLYATQLQGTFASNQGEDVEVFDKHVKVGRYRFLCTIVMVSNGADAVNVTASGVECFPKKPRNLIVRNLMLKGELLTYRVTFKINPSKILRARIVKNRSCKTGVEVFLESTPSENWLNQCKNIMQGANMFDNFATAVGHGIHTISLQDIRSFFDKEAKPTNGVPTMNRDLCSDDQDIVLLDAPDISQEFSSIGLHTLDVALQKMDDPNYMQFSNVLSRLVHSFHMQEIYTAAQPHYEKFATEGVDHDVCACVLDIFENGIHQELRNIFMYFRADRSLFGYDYKRKMKIPTSRIVSYGYDKEAIEKPNLPKLTSSTSWVQWKAMIKSSMLGEEDVKKVAMFIYCALNKD